MVWDTGPYARRNPTSTEPRSALSGRSLEEIAEEGKNAGENQT